MVKIRIVCHEEARGIALHRYYTLELLRRRWWCLFLFPVWSTHAYEMHGGWQPIQYSTEEDAVDAARRLSAASLPVTRSRRVIDAEPTLSVEDRRSAFLIDIIDVCSRYRVLAEEDEDASFCDFPELTLQEYPKDGSLAFSVMFTDLFTENRRALWDEIKLNGK